MDVVVYDTDVASHVIRQRLAPALAAALAPYPPCVTFVSIGELVEWGYTRDWSSRSMLGIDAWLSRVPKIWCDDAIARTWGRLSGRGRDRP